MRLILKFIKLDKIAVRLVESDSVCDMLSMIYAASLCAKKLYVSAEKSVEKKLSDKSIIYENTDDFIKQISGFSRIRYSSKNSVENGVYDAAAKTGIYVATAPVLGFGRLELLHYLQEQTIVINN